MLYFQYKMLITFQIYQPYFDSILLNVFSRRAYIFLITRQAYINFIIIICEQIHVIIISNHQQYILGQEIIKQSLSDVEFYFYGFQFNIYSKQAKDTQNQYTQKNLQFQSFYDQ
ncbi:hypothetical protein pb186bvf_018138 [Paramecium bursaria]